MGLLSPLPLEPAGESLFDLQDEEADLWAIRLDPGNSLDMFSLKDMGTIPDDISTNLLDKDSTPVEKPKRIRKKKKKQKPPPLYTESFNPEYSTAMQRSIYQSKKCKRYRDRVKAEQNNLRRQHEEDVLQIKKLSEINERLLQENKSKDEEIEKLQNFIKRLMAQVNEMH